jgi:GMP synthase (glutamine-hydrolysing)
MLQIRSSKVPMQQEQSCFIERCRVARKQFEFINVVDEPEIRWRQVESAHAVFIGGAGAFSVTDRHPFTDPLRDVVARLIDEDRPVFGSCWGHQFLAASFGGEVITDMDRAEVGSYSVELTEAGARDPIFAEFPRTFTVQLGHHDRVSVLGPDWQELAFSELCANQAIRLRDKPVYGTQFHSEMNEYRLSQRIGVYRDAYMPDPEEFERLDRSLKPSLEADRLLSHFLECYV